MTTQGLKVGDKVKVNIYPIPMHMGMVLDHSFLPSGWVDGMVKTMGKTYTVEEIENDNIGCLSIRLDNWWWYNEEDLSKEGIFLEKELFEL